MCLMMRNWQFLRIVLVSVLLSWPVFSYSPQGSKRFNIVASKVSFVSTAPHETISAFSTAMKGLIDPSNRAFAFSIHNTTFSGFNNPLQKEHFNENYMETDKYPDCSFSGRIIDDLDFSKPGVTTVRAKGLLRIRGVSKERIIKAQVSIKDNELLVSAIFDVTLHDHDIRIPRLVYQKIAPVVTVTLNASMKREAGP